MTVVLLSIGNQLGERYRPIDQCFFSRPVQLLDAVLRPRGATAITDGPAENQL